MKQDNNKTVCFPNLHKEAEPWIAEHKEFFGDCFSLSGRGWTLDLSRIKENVCKSQIVCSQKSIPLNESTDNIVSRMQADTCQRFERQNDMAARKYLGKVDRFAVLSRVYNIDKKTAEKRFGLVPHLHNANILLQFARSKEVPQVLKREILPIMHESFGMTHVLPLRMSIEYLHKINVLAKLNYISKEKGYPIAEQMIKNDTAHRGLEMRAGRYFMNLLEAFTRFGEITFAYPFSRNVHSWHFFKDSGLREPHESTRGVSSIMFVPDQTRKSEGEVEESKTHKIFESSIQQYNMSELCLLGSVYGVNNLMEYLCDIRNFIMNGDEFDSVKFLKTVSTIRLIIADFQGIMYSPEPNTQMILSLSLLDKIANLVVGNSEENIEERQIFMKLLREDRENAISEVYEQKLSIKYHTLGVTLSRAMQRCFNDARLSLCLTENGMLCRKNMEANFRSLRNVNHGSFREGKAFERMFLKGGKELPVEITMLPYFLMWAFALSPKNFLRRMSE